MCAGPEAEPDPARPYWSAVFAGLFYSIFGLLAGLITGFAGLAPEGVVPAVAGIALMGVLFNSLTGALKEETMREGGGHHVSCDGLGRHALRAWRGRLGALRWAGLSAG